jgi:hypothetical protein
MRGSPLWTPWTTLRRGQYWTPIQGQSSKPIDSRERYVTAGVAERRRRHREFAAAIVFGLRGPGRTSEADL